MNEVDSIEKLESILNEFYHQSTSNFRKKEIEVELKKFQDNDSSWNFVIHHLGSSGFNNQYLWFFSVSTIEVSTTKDFLSLSTEPEIFSAAHDNKKMEQVRCKIKNSNPGLSLAYLLQFSAQHWCDAA